MPADDPLSATESTGVQSSEAPQLPSTTSPSPALEREPFSTGWDASPTAASGDAAAQRDVAGAGLADAPGEKAQGHTHAPADPSFDLSTASPSPAEGLEPTRFSFNPAASAFTPSFTAAANADEPNLAPIALAKEPRSSSHNRSSSGASTLDVATSATPRGAPSPLAHRQSLDPATDPRHSPSPPPASPPRPAQPSRSPSTVSSSRGYDPTTLRNLIASACVNGDLERLQSLMHPRAAEEGEPEPSSTFTLANQTGSHSGLAPLHYAAQKGHADIVKWLIEEAGAMPELEDSEGETPLHKASHRGHLDVCRFLISRDVDVNTPDSDGWTALHNAASRGWLDVARLLVEAGAHVDAQSTHRYTALMNAASKGQLPLVNFLLKKGADPLGRNAYGETAYDLAAAVFEVQICAVLAAAETAALSLSSGGEIDVEAPFNPLALHSTVPVVLHENQRLALPTLRKLSSLGGAAKWTPEALSRNDGRAAYSMPALGNGYGGGAVREENDELPCFRSEVRLPVVGSETTLGVPEPREVRSGGRVRVPAEADAARPSSSSSSSAAANPQPIRPRPQTRRTSSSAASSLTAVLAASPSLSPEPLSSASTSGGTRGEPAWIWASEWVIDFTAPASSPSDGWSYAASFDAPPNEWAPAPPPEVHRAMDGGPAALAALAAGGGGKFVRRRRWVRLMRRRLDLPDFGYADVRAGTTGYAERAEGRVEEIAMRGMDYRARARFLAGAGRSAGGDASSVRSGKSSALGRDELPPEEEEDRVALRRVAARLERAADELRRGMGEDEDDERRRAAQDELETFVHELALVRARLGAVEEEEDADSDDEFVYSGRDADADDDARSVWTTMRPPSVASGPTSASDYFTQPRPSSPSASLRPVLTPQMAPEFRVPTHEQAPGARFNIGPYLHPRPIRPRWEPDEATNECRRCSKRFGLLTRKHHCRRCGLVVCAACSQHNDALDPYTVALEPGDFREDEHVFSATPRRYRTCSECHTALSLLQGTGTGTGGPTSLLSPQAFFPASPSLGSVTPSEAAASDVSELVECPVCGTPLASVGDKAAQETHIRDCLDTGGGTVSSGRYLAFKLPPGPLVGQECAICFEDFVAGSRVARLVCLCTFHQHCIVDWLSRGNSCPVHPNHREP